jgi:alkylation response protein AidB-like acyl-CoA dehydrogenase
LPLRFPRIQLPPGCHALRLEVRAFLDEALRELPPIERAKSWLAGFDPAFTRRLGARGWIGMTWPRRYGGHERSALERHVVLEELLAAGAPVAAHWVADRQSGPLLLRYGTEAQRERFLPAIARGELLFCIGMSEPDAGSDLAALRTRATRVPGGWRLDGTKLWTSNADGCHYMIALVRTGPAGKSRHENLSQLLVDLSTPGITIRPIQDLAGGRHFDEVNFEGAFVPEDCGIGREGEGWSQVMAELAYERSGPERYLSSLPLLTELVRELGADANERAAVAIGRAAAELGTLRQMSLSVAGMLAAGDEPALEAAVVKDLGTEFEQWIPQLAYELLGAEPTVDDGSAYQRMLGYLTQTAPSFSLRGGTREILRGIIARGLGLR